MNRLKQIQQRLALIKQEIEKEGADLDALESEISSLTEERAVLMKQVQQRSSLLAEVSNATDAEVIRSFPSPATVVPEARDNQEVTSAEYRTAFLKRLLGEELSEVEQRAFTHTTANTGSVIPTELQNKIYSTMEEAHPILKDVQILRTGTVISIVKHVSIDEGDAKNVAEGVANDDEKNTFINVSLSGKDFSKHVDFSYRLGKMAIPAFEQYLVKEISDRIGSAMAKDIIAQIKKDLNAKNKITAKVPGKLALADVLNTFKELKQAGKVFVYTNNSTFYGSIAQMEGMEGRLSFIPNYQDQISGQILGKGIKEEDALIDGDVLILDPSQFIYNVVQDIMLERDKDIKKHVHTISGFAIAEGTMTNDKAGALLTVGVGV